VHPSPYLSAGDHGAVTQELDELGHCAPTGPQEHPHVAADRGWKETGGMDEILHQLYRDMHQYTQSAGLIDRATCAKYAFAYH
jgi:hypothetical protein